MPQQELPIDKTFRMSVKLINENGDHVPFKGGFVLVPEDRLLLLEKLAASALTLTASHRAAITDVNAIGQTVPALKALGDAVIELKAVWEIPQ